MAFQTARSPITIVLCNTRQCHVGTEIPNRPQSKHAHIGKQFPRASLADQRETEGLPTKRCWCLSLGKEFGPLTSSVNVVVQVNSKCIKILNREWESIITVKR